MNPSCRVSRVGQSSVLQNVKRRRTKSSKNLAGSCSTPGFLTLYSMPYPSGFFCLSANHQSFKLKTADAPSSSLSLFVHSCRQVGSQNHKVFDKSYLFLNASQHEENDLDIFLLKKKNIPNADKRYCKCRRAWFLWRMKNSLF